MPTTVKPAKKAKFDIDNTSGGPKMRTSLAISTGLHEAIHFCANAEKRSFNNYIEMKLAEVIKAELERLGE